ncbi:MAG: DUF454 domain-containing protein, partial [Comamonadaceae bacterium]
QPMARKATQRCGTNSSIETALAPMAAWAAALSSPRLSHWLENHPRLGPPITDWRRSGVVGRRSKWMATAAMGASAVSMLLFVPQRWVAFLAIGCLATVLWLWLRPEEARP